METFINKIVDYLKNFVSQYSFFIDVNYYSALFSKYFSVTGFIVGFVFVLLVYFSNPDKYKKVGFFKTLAIIALINSCSVLVAYLDDIFHIDSYYNGIESLLNAPDNIISGSILTLVIVSCYKVYSGRVFLFGMATHAALPMLNFTYFGELSAQEIFLLLLRVILAGFLCLIISHRRYFYTSWIWYFGFHMLLRIITFLMPLTPALIYRHTVATSAEYSFPYILEYFSRFSLDYAIFLVVLIFSIVFEKAVIPIKEVKATA